MNKISIKQLERHLSEYLNVGEDFVITKYNKQIAIVSFKNIVTIKPLNEPIVSSFLSDGILQPAKDTLQPAMDTRSAAMDTRLKPMETRLSKPMDTRSVNKPVKKPVNKPFKTYFKTKDNPAGL